jgi:hypothetical protein
MYEHIYPMNHFLFTIIETCIFFSKYSYFSFTLNIGYSMLILTSWICWFSFFIIFESILSYWKYFFVKTFHNENIL